MEGWGQKGIYIFSIGLFKKIVIADTVALIANNGYSLNQFSFYAAWITALCYTIQIYFDFSGYSDMAIGLGKMFNIDIPTNFLSPYKSESITEFWRRWHITLGRALSSYVYIPLGGNRKGTLRTYINLFLTFFVSGLWHGAAWTFVVWGICHGVFVIFERAAQAWLVKIPKALRITATFIIINFLWVLFRAPNFTQALNLYKGMFTIPNVGFLSISELAIDGLILFPKIIFIFYIFALILISLFLIFLQKNTIEKASTFAMTNKNMFFTICLLIISVIHLSRESIFIYFNF